jgi:hypothetical protein
MALDFGRKSDDQAFAIDAWGARDVGSRRYV